MALASSQLSAARLPCQSAAPRSVVGRGPSLPPPPGAVAANKNNPAASARCRASSSRRRRDDDAEFSCGGGGLVDDGMVVLRRRIHEMEAAERNWEPPHDWARWEKEWCATYDADVCDLAAMLRALLTGLRPGVGVGLLAALALALPASAFVLVSHVLDASRALLSNLHH